VQDVLVALVVAGLFCLIFWTGCYLFIRNRIRRKLRIKPGTASAAPTTWLVSNWEPAQLHRRLRKVAIVARGATSVADKHSQVASVGRDIEDRAVAVDAHIVLVSRMWRREPEARAALREQVTELEHLATRTAAAATSQKALTMASEDPLADLRERLDALEAARVELIAIERNTGLGA
jgi:hypothetical protein